ncbi:unnamed protein product [Rotaria sp. Silwood1]|nr:unnamed protein product [Rotaria sp. Silwood1]CAF1639534.1 unnamed protein product [Rotaria sp. Silwood1]
MENLKNSDQQNEYLTIKQRNNNDNIHKIITSILVDYADPEYEHELSSLITIHYIISQERFKTLLKLTNNKINFEELSTIILPKQQAIECKTLLDSFHQRINYRQKRFKRIENLQKLLLSSISTEKFLEMISDLVSPNHLHILDPIIEKYSIFLTTIIIRIISNKELLKICAYEQKLDTNDQSHRQQESSIDISVGNADRKSAGVNLSRMTILDLRETSLTLQSIFDCYTLSMSMYTHNSVLRHKIEQTIIITIFDYILHFNHRTMINEQLRKLFNGFKPLAVYKVQLLIEKELIVIKLLLNIRKQQALLTIDDLNIYLESYPIPCRLDIVNELRGSKIISQSLANITAPEAQAIFLIYMMITLIQKEAILKNQSSEYKTVIQEQFLINILDRKQLTNIQFELALNQNMRRRQVIQTNILSDQIKTVKIVKEKAQRTVDHALLKMDENIQSFSKPIQISSRLTYNSLVKQHKSLIENNQELLIIDKNINNELLPNLRSLRHNYIQTKIPRNQLHLLVEQGCGCGCSLDLIRHIIYHY